MYGAHRYRRFSLGKQSEVRDQKFKVRYQSSKYPSWRVKNYHTLGVKHTPAGGKQIEAMKVISFIFLNKQHLCRTFVTSELIKKHF